MAILQINVRVRDSKAFPLENCLVRIYDENTIVFERTTDENGDLNYITEIIEEVEVTLPNTYDFDDLKDYRLVITHNKSQQYTHWFNTTNYNSINWELRLLDKITTYVSSTSEHYDLLIPIFDDEV